MTTVRFVPGWAHLPEPGKMIDERAQCVCFFFVSCIISCPSLHGILQIKILECLGNAGSMAISADMYLYKSLPQS